MTLFSILTYITGLHKYPWPPPPLPFYGHAQWIPLPLPPPSTQCSSYCQAAVVGLQFWLVEARSTISSSILNSAVSEKCRLITERRYSQRRAHSATQWRLAASTSRSLRNSTFIKCNHAFFEMRKVYVRNQVQIFKIELRNRRFFPVSTNRSFSSTKNIKFSNFSKVVS